MKCVEFGTFLTQTRAENEMRRIWYISYTKLVLKILVYKFYTRRLDPSIPTSSCTGKIEALNGQLVTFSLGALSDD